MIQAYALLLRWQWPEGLQPREQAVVQQRVSEVLASWVGTPYGSGQRCRGTAVDCVRFACAVLDELRGRPSDLGPSPPADVAFHSRSTAMAALRAMLRAYAPCDLLRDGTVEPGDIVLVGPERGGPGHAMIVGAVPGLLVHATPPAVQRAGYGTLTGMPRLEGVVRLRDKRAWVRRSDVVLA